MKDQFNSHRYRELYAAIFMVEDKFIGREDKSSVTVFWDTT